MGHLTCSGCGTRWNVAVAPREPGDGRCPRCDWPLMTPDEGVPAGERRPIWEEL